MAVDELGDRTDWVGRRALDRHGTVIGTVVDVYDDSRSGRTKWLVIASGYFGTRRTVAPVQDASWLGDDVVVAHRKDVIVAAPHARTFTAINPADERIISAHYAHRESPAAGAAAERQHP